MYICCSAPTKKIMSIMNFDELVSGATVRFALIQGVQYLSIRDLIMVVCDQDNKHASKTWSRISDERFSEVSTFCRNLKFPGPGQKEQQVTTFDGALKLLMWLPGEKAKDFRTKVAEILKRYFAGDPTLLDDIQANAVSNCPINQAARASLQEYSVSKRQKLIPTQEEISRCKEFGEFITMLQTNNTHYKEFIELRKEEVKVELMSKEHLMRLSLKEKAENNKLDNKIRKDELKYKQALLALETQPNPILTTVLKVYQANKESFPLLKHDQKRSFLIQSGTLATNAYVCQYGVQPSKVSEQGFHVNAFPPQAEDIVMQSLRSAYKNHIAGGGQSTIMSSFKINL